MDNSPFFTLHDVANWRENQEADNSKFVVELPKVQRSFVWKASQIEDLWDTIIRKFPFGAFVFNIGSNQDIQLLDGQQRATAITLGFENKTFRGDEKYYRIFIDLEQPVNDQRKYYIRVITDSHPWGYERKSNNKPLEAQQKREAIKLWDEIDLINPDLNKCFPFDSGLPVPLHFFLDAAENNISNDQLIEIIYEWELFSKVKAKLNSYVKVNENRIPSNSSLLMLNHDDSFVTQRITAIYSDIIQALNHHKIPALYLHNLLEMNEANSNSSNEDENEVENLFIRLNAGGTPLRGEELNYSILKSKIDKNTQKLIEEACKYFVNPARFITVSFRLFQLGSKSKTTREALGMNIKPKQFQAALHTKKEIDNFEEFIKGLLINKDFDSYTLISYTKRLYEYDSSYNLNGFPHLIAKKLVSNSPELLFIFWYRLIKMQDRFTTVPSDDVHCKMLGLMSLFLWVGKGEKNRDYSKLLTNIWPALKLLERDLFWSSATVQRAMQDGVLLPIPSFKTNTIKNPGLKWFGKQNPNLKTALFDKFYKLTEVAYNADILFFTNDLVLYAQKEFLHHIFQNKQFHLDDTNVPFDWDHIYPSKLIAKKGLPRLVKDFYNSIGNFRAWPYELNRMDSDDVPAIKFNPLKGSEDLDNTKASWLHFIAKYPSLISKLDEIPNKLLNWSVCETSWAESNVTDVKRYGKEVCMLIIARAINILGIWYNQLQIDSLIPLTNKGKSNIIQNCFNSLKVEINPKWLNKEDWVLDESVNLILKKKIKIENTELCVFITFNSHHEDLINLDEIYFGFYDIKNSGFMNKIKLPENSPTELNKVQKYIQSSFTLVSEHEQSQRALFKDILTWIDSKDLPIKSIQNQVKNLLLDALKKNFKP
jgi:hypothetical protein